MLCRGRAKRGKHLREKKLKLDNNNNNNNNDNNNNNNNNNKFNTRMVSMEREKIDSYCDLKYEIKSPLKSASKQKCRGIVLICCA